MRLERQIPLAFAVALLLFLGISTLAYRSLRQMRATATDVDHTHQVILHLEKLLSDLQDAETGQRGFLLTGRENYLDPYERALAAINRDRGEMRGLTSDNAEQQQRLDRLEQVIDAKLAELKTTIEARRKEGQAAAERIVLTDAGKQAMVAARGLIAEMEDAEQRLLSVRTERTHAATRRALAVLVLASIVALIFILTAIFVIRRQLRRIRQAEAALQEANTSLERKVAERTVDLREASERLRVTLSSIGDAVIATDDEGRVEYLNPVAEALTGWTMADAMGHPLPEVFHIVNETTRVAVESPVVRVLREGVTVGLANHTVLLARDGREIAIDDSGAPIRDAQGGIMGAVLVFRDIGAKRKAELERDRIFTMSLDLLCITDTTGRFRRVNPAFTTVLGWTEEELLGQANLHFVHPDDRAATIAEGNRILAGETSHNFENRYRCRDGNYRVLSWTAQPLLSEGLIYSVARDVTEQKAAAAALARRARLSMLRAEVASQLARPVELAETLRAVCEKIVEQMEAAFARIWTLNEAEQVLELQASAGLYTHLDGPHRRVPVGQFKIGRIAARRLPHLSNDVSHDPEVSDQAWAAREGMQAFAGYPLIVENRLIGVVALFARQALAQESFDELATVADSLAQMIQRKRTEATLRASEERYRTLFESIDEGFCVIEFFDGPHGPLSDYIHVEANPAFAANTGIPNIVGQKVRELVPDEADGWVEIYRNVLTTGTPIRFERELVATGRQLELAAFRVEPPERRQVAVLFKDITARKQAEEALRASQSLNADVLDSMSAHISVLDQDGTIRLVNKAWQKFAVDNGADWTLRGVGVGTNYLEICRTAVGDHTEEAPAIYQGLREILNGTRTFFSLEYPCHSPTAERWFLLMASPLSTGGGAVVSHQNITERRKAESALRASEERYRVLTEVSPQVVWMADPEGRIDYFNQHWFDYTGMTLEESAGRGWTRAIDPQHRNRLRDAVITAATTGETWRIEIPFRRASDGEYRWHLSVGRPLRDAEGRITRWIGVAIDIHDRKLAEEELELLLGREQRSRQEAEEAGRLKDEFLAVVSHELRTPLNAINGYTQLLRDENINDETARQYLATIDRNAKSQMRLIEDLLDVSRIITGKLRLNITRTDLRAVAEAALDAVRPAAEAKHLELTLTVTDQLAHPAHARQLDPLDPNQPPTANAQPLLLMADPARLQQVIWNLLSNAVKFTPKRGAVKLELRRIESRVEVEVRDTGEGITPDFLPYVFDRFRQADSTSRRTHQGLGLGLAIVRHLVELHGGDVAAFSEGTGRGANFVVRLPIKAVVVDLGEAAPTPAPLEEAPDDFSLDLTGLYVLAVDDEADSLAMIRAVLERRGAEVRTCLSAQEALAAFTTRRPDLIVSDIGMPEMNGHDFIRAVRDLEGSGPHVPAIALTAYAGAADRVRAFGAGFQFHLAKPVEPTELAVTVASLADRLGQS